MTNKTYRMAQWRPTDRSEHCCILWPLSVQPGKGNFYQEKEKKKWESVTIFWFHNGRFPFDQKNMCMSNTITFPAQWIRMFLFNSNFLGKRTALKCMLKFFCHFRVSVEWVTFCDRYSFCNLFKTFPGNLHFI